jgi:Fe-S-cluster-containing dehydrogenase component
MDNEREKAGIVDEFVHKTTSRREFLKVSGKGVAGSVLTIGLLNFLSGCATTVPGQAKKRSWATASGAIIHDPSRCSGCRRCELNCTIANDGKAHPYIARVKIGRNLNYGQKGPSAAYWAGDGQFGDWKINGETCRQCKEPYCGNACPQHAISVDPDTGARVVDEAKCIGCGTCQRECPWGMIVVDPEEKKSKKCLLCHGDPQCVRYCPNGALKFVPWDEAIRLYKEHWESHI